MANTGQRSTRADFIGRAGMVIELAGWPVLFAGAEAIAWGMIGAGFILIGAATLVAWHDASARRARPEDAKTSS